MLSTDIVGTVRHHASASLAEADRLMTVCNACRYCEGLCAVFPAMEMRRSFSDGDLSYLANLCHNCGACYYDCQFAPPHEFNVNIPATFARVRAESYAHCLWPRALAKVFERNGLFTALALVLAVTAFIVGFMAWTDPAILFGVNAGPGAFYRLMPHNVMVAIFGVALLYAILAIGIGARGFWHYIGEKGSSSADAGSFWQAVKDAGRLRYLDGGGGGCMNEEEAPRDRRRLYHHLTFYGFMLCFAATSTATLYHYLMGLEAPYAWYDVPVLLGVAGGLGLVIGPIGLLAAKWRRDPEMRAGTPTGMDVAFLLMLLLTSVTGLALLFLRSTPAMGLLLALHLGVVSALFVTMPYGKFVHGIYRFIALMKAAKERHRAFANSE